MALSTILRGAASKVHGACPMAALTLRSGVAPMTLSSRLFTVLARSNVKQSLVTDLAAIRPVRCNQLQGFSTSPKSYSAGANHNHSKLWTIERVLSAVLLAVIPVALMTPNKLLDTIAAVSLVMHSHWGIEAIVVDYVRPILFGTTVPKIAMGAVYVLSIVTLAGLFQLIYNDDGFANTVRKIWSL